MGFTVHSADHTGITVSDLDRALEFWHGALGFELLRRGELGGTFAEEVTGIADAQITMAVVGTPDGHRIELLRYAQGQTTEQRPCDPGAMHIAFTVDDLDAVLAAAAAHGFAPAGTPQAKTAGARAGARFAYMRDPDGTTVELIQPAD